MLLERALSLLDALARGQPVSMDASELEELRGQALLQTLDRGSRDRLAADVAGLSEAIQEARALAQGKGPRPPGTTEIVGHPTAMNLQAATLRLEELTRRQTLLSSLEWNQPTATFVYPTLGGRRILPALSVWNTVGAIATFDEFMAWRRELLGQMEGTVKRALLTLTEIRSLSPQIPSGQLRGPTMVLTRRPDTPEHLADRFEQALGGTEWNIKGSQEELSAMALLASGEGSVEDGVRAFGEVKERLQGLGFEPDAQTLLAAALADLEEDSRSLALERLRDLRGLYQGLHPVALAWMSLSPQAPLEVQGRYEKAWSSIGQRQAGDPEVAAAIIAGSSEPLEGLFARYDRLAASCRTPLTPPSLPLPCLPPSPWTQPRPWTSSGSA